MPSIQQAIQWAIQTCNAENVGYSQAYRNAQTVNGITYYDCSSFIYYALIAGRFNLDPTINAFTTSTMGTKLLSLGFKEISISSEWKAGDIVWREGHTEMVYSGRVTMGAHTDGIALANQVSINNSASSVSEWSKCYRYGTTPQSLSWIYGNRYLNETEMQNNAQIVYSYLSGKGWTLNAIAGLLGNMESESTINPAIWQSLNQGNMSGGYGLVQWTPATNYLNWANANGYSTTDGYKQLQWIDEETTSFGQWIATTNYNFSFNEFKTSTQTPQYLASAFLKNFERAGVEVEEERRAQALKWFNYLQNFDPIIPLPIYKRKRKGFNFLLFTKKGRNINAKTRIIR